MIRDDWNDRLPASGWDTGREAITLAQAEVAVFRTVFGAGLELGGGGVPRVRAGRVARDCSARSSARCGRCASSCGRPWMVTRRSMTRDPGPGADCGRGLLVVQALTSLFWVFDNGPTRTLFATVPAPGGAGDGGKAPAGAGRISVDGAELVWCAEDCRNSGEPMTAREWTPIIRQPDEARLPVQPGGLSHPSDALSAIDSACSPRSASTPSRLPCCPTTALRNYGW